MESDENQVKWAKQVLDETKERAEPSEESARLQFHDEALLDHREAIENIRRGRNSFDDSVRNLPERIAELQGLEGSLNERLRDIGLEWDEDRLESFDSSIVTRDHIEQVRQLLAGKVVQVQQRTAQSGQAQDDLLEREEVKKEALDHSGEIEKPTLDAGELEQKRSSFRSTRTRFEEFARLRLRHSDLRDQLESTTGQAAVSIESTWIQSRELPLLVAVVAIMLITASATLGQEALVIGCSAGALLLIVAI